MVSRRQVRYPVLFLPYRSQELAAIGLSDGPTRVAFDVPNCNRSKTVFAHFALLGNLNFVAECNRGSFKMESGGEFTSALCPLYCSDCIVEIAAFERMDLPILSL